MKRVLVYVQHLLGVGHLHRTALITQALAKYDLEVVVVTGGVPVEEIDFAASKVIQLPPIKTDAGFSALYDRSGQVITDAFKERRKAALLNAYQSVKPDLVLIETYPFGRRQMRFELLPLLEAIHSSGEQRPKLVTSIRDVIQPKSKSQRIEEVINIVNHYFDAVLVHGDERFIPFEQSFAQAQQIASKLHYTGYVAKPLPPIQDNTLYARPTVLVSAGGGAVGQAIYQTALLAAQSPQGQHYDWHVLVGHNVQQESFKTWQQNSGQNVRLEANRRDFIDLMRQCSVSVSQAGYNTIMDVLVTSAKSVVIPFEGVAEREQLIRAEKLAQKGALKIIREAQLNPEVLLMKIEQLHRCKSPSTLSVNIQGADHSAKICRRLLGAAALD